MTTFGAAVAQTGISLFCRAAITRNAEVDVEGLQHLPSRGPLVIASRHHHHFYDAAVLVATVRRPLHFLVALDWVKGGWQRRFMEAVCRWAAWPVLLRGERLDDRDQWRRDRNGYRRHEVSTYVRRAVRDSIQLLLEGEALVVFPEGYPTVDPEGSLKAAPDEILPFRPGFIRLASAAERRGSEPVSIVPTGLEYVRGARWRITVRFGQAVVVGAQPDRQAVGRRVEKRVRELSGLAGRE